MLRVLCYMQCNTAPDAKNNNAVRAEITQMFLTTAYLCFLTENMFMLLIL